MTADLIPLSGELMRDPRTLEEIRRDPEQWRRAAAAWLESKASPRTRRAYSRAVGHFFNLSNKQPWEIAGADVVAWQSHLRARKLEETTINLYLAALSSMYRYCCTRYTVLDPATGREEPLAVSNPASRPERASVDPFGRATALDRDQAEALISAVDRSTVVGLRDYALLVGYLLTGARNSELRRLRWGDLREDGNRVIWAWSGKGGKSERREFPWPAYHTIGDYLRVAGRLDSIGDDDYVFIAHSDVAARLPNVDELGAAGARPLSSGMVNRLVKRYAQLAGIKARVTTHALRHTAAMLRREHSQDLQDLQRFLHHSSLSTTEIYIHHLGVTTDPVALKVAAQLGVQ